MTFAFTGLGGNPAPTLLVEQIQDGVSVGGVTVRPPEPNVLYLPVSVRAATVAGTSAQQQGQGLHPRGLQPREPQINGSRSGR